MVLSGIITAMVTPFDNQENIDYQATEELIEYLLAKGVHGIFILGTNGEFHVLSQQEKIEFTKFVAKTVRKRVPVIVGVGGNSTREVIALTKEIEQFDVDYLSVITPYFSKLTDDELLYHYRSIAKSSRLPILLYNIPKMTGNPLSKEVVGRLADSPNIVGIKDSSGNIENIRDYIEVTKEKDFFVLSGSDSLILAALQLGATGAVAATSNAIPENDIRIYSEFIVGNIKQAQVAQSSIEKFRQILKYGTVPSVLKYTIFLRGISVGQPRKPVQAVATKYLNEIVAIMEQYRKESEGEE